MIGVSNYSNFAAEGSPGWVLGQTPNWHGGAFDGWRHVKSAFAQDFRCDQAVCDGRNVVVEACVDVSRDSFRALNGSDGLLRTFDENEPARIEGVGIFIGDEFINKIRNPRGEGGVVGAGALPTNWSNISGGLTTTFLGNGEEDGLPYADIHFAGTATG